MMHYLWCYLHNYNRKRYKLMITYLPPNSPLWPHIYGHVYVPIDKPKNPSLLLEANLAVSIY